MTIVRPTYYEGQLLGAADLLNAVDYGRAKRERHDRYLHRWGIVAGCDLVAEDAEDAGGNPFKRVFVEPGIAIDGAGREILVSERQTLDPELFKTAQRNDIKEDESYPVFLSSRFAVASPGAQALGMCDTGQSTRITEGVEITFGRLGDEAIIDEPPAAPIGADPSPSEGFGGWFILLGFVQWDDGLQQFSNAQPSAGGVTRRYVGVNAETVAAQDGTLTLQTRQKSEVGNPVLQLNEEDGGQLCFGLFKGPGPLEKLVTISNNGDITTVGKLADRTTTTFHVESGVASDGMIIPLPPGITQEQVDDGTATIHIMVSPRIDSAYAPSVLVIFGTPIDWGVLVQDCRVDEERRLICRLCWLFLDFFAPSSSRHIVSMPGTCDFLVVGTIKPEGGGGS